MGAEAEAEHDGRGQDEEDLTLFRGEEVARDGFDPAVGAKLDRADEGVGDEEHEEEEGADGEAGDDADGDQQDAGEVEAKVVDVEDRTEDVTEEDREQVAGDERAQDTDVLEHLGEGGAFLGGFRLREGLAHEHDRVGDGRDEVERELSLPAEAHDGTEEVGGDGADDHAEGPGGVQDVEVVRALLGEDRGDERVGHGFEGAVREGEDEHAPVEEVIRVLRGRGAEGDERREDVAEEGDGDELAVADLVDDHAADDDTEAEAREASATDGTELGGVEAVFGRPSAEDAAAEGEADAGREDSHEAGPEEALRIRNRSFCAHSMLREGVRV